MAGGVLHFKNGELSQLCFSLFLKASVGRQSPRVVPYPAHSLCPGEPGLQSAAGKATVCASVCWSGCQRK